MELTIQTGTSSSTSIWLLLLWWQEREGHTEVQGKAISERRAGGDGHSVTAVVGHAVSSSIHWGRGIKNNMIVLLLSKSLNYIILEVEGQPQYFTDRKASLIVFDRISTRLANLNGFRTNQGRNTNEWSGPVQNVKSPFPENTVGNGEDWGKYAFSKGSSVCSTLTAYYYEGMQTQCCQKSGFLCERSQMMIKCSNWKHRVY